MNVEQWQQTVIKAIKSNYRMRNLREYSDPAQQSRAKQKRRAEIRRWCALLRQARNPQNTEALTQALRWRIH